MNFEAVIGIEIHVEMKTKTKMFSSSLNKFGELPNTLVSPVDVAFPGTMPVVNKKAVINAIRVCNALHMTIDNQLWFDRKNYFYSDLPKGFQITQDKRPIGRNGYIEIDIGNKVKRIGIERLHMEEDTCKQLHLADCTLLDYNRAGTPLIEIVSLPEMKSGEEAMKYVEQIRSIVIYSGVSDGKMEEGSLRCDVNISLRPCGSDRLGTKVEIKNLNSLANVQRAIDFEIKRQSNILLNGGEVEQETRRFDETNRETVLMRKKTNAVDYKYFTEPNIAPINLSDEFIKNAIDSCPELASQKLTRYVGLGLTKDEANQILSFQDLVVYFDECLVLSKSIKMIWNFVTGDIASYLNKNNLTMSEFKVTPNNLVKLLSLIEKGEISVAQGRKILDEMVLNNEDPVVIQEKLGLKQNSNEDEIRAMCESVIDENPQSVEDYKNGKDRAIGFIIGQVMKQSKGKANPQMVNKIVIEIIKEK